MDFSEMVKHVRKQLGMSQEELAYALKVSFATISRWENAKTRPNKMTKSVFWDFCKQSGLDMDSYEK